MAKKNGFFADFKTFITRGNILDMAVGVIIGGAFGKIVSSLVADIIMPVIGKLFNTSSLADLKYILTEAVTETAADGTVTEISPEVAIKYGQFIQYIVDFLIVAFCMFIVIRLFMKMREKMEAKKRAEEEAAAAEAAANAAPPEPTVEEKTLATLEEIKELLAKK